MPQTTYSVKFPDGHVQQFSGPDSMSDVDVQNRAIQERAFAEDKIPSTFYQGAKKSVGETIADSSGKIGTAVSLAGGLAGQPEIVAAGPLVGRAVKAGGEALAGRDITPTSASELGMLGAEGAVAAYGPALVAKSLRGLGAATAPHQLPNGTWVPGLKGTGAVPWAIRTAGEAVEPVAAGLEKITPEAVGSAAAADVKMLAEKVALARTGVSADDYKLMMDSIAKGMRPATAIKVVSNGDPSMFGKLMTLYMRSRSVKP